MRKVIVAEAKAAYSIGFKQKYNRNQAALLFNLLPAGFPK